MVKEKRSLNQLLRRKIMREIKNNLKQFLALILIAGLAVTLYVGLSANAKALKNRVDQLYEEGNIADIFVYVTGYLEDDKYAISQIDGVDDVETRFSLDSCTVYQDTGTLMIAPEDNTICIPAELDGENGAVLDSYFADSHKIKIGSQIKISLPYSVDYLLEGNTSAEKLIALSDGFLKEGKENPLCNKLTFYPTVTGKMKHPETVEREFSSGTCYLQENVFRNLFKDLFFDCFNETFANAIYDQFKDFSLINQYLIKVKKGANVDKVGQKIFEYFNPNTIIDNNAEVETKYWGDYNGTYNDVNYSVSISKKGVFINDKRYVVTSHDNSLYEVTEVGGNTVYQINFDGENAVLTKKGDTSFSVDMTKASSIYVTSLTKENLPSTAVMEQDIYQAKQLCLVFPTIFFIVAALVILTSLSQTIFRSRSEIGTMKALGIPKKRILLHYISLGVVLSMIGAILGAIAGPLIIPLIMNIKYSILYNLPALKIVFPFDSILLCIGVFAGLSILVTFGVTYSEIKLNPVESMRPKPAKSFKNKVSKDNKACSTMKLSMRMAFRNIFAKKTRIIMVVFGVMGCTALTVAGFGILDTIYYGLNLDMYETYVADINACYGPDQEDTAYEFLIDNENVMSIQQYENKVLRASANSISKDTFLQIFEKDKVNAYTFLDDVTEGIAISKATADELEVKKGDYVSLIYLGKTYDAKVDVIFESSYWLSIYTLDGIFPEFEFNPTGSYINVKDGVNSDKFATSIKDIESDDVKLFSSVISLEEYQRKVDDTVSSVKMMCNTVKVFAILLAVVVTYNLASLNFVERRRDIATFKVLGFTSREIGMSLIFELLLLTLVGVIFGLFLGFPLNYLIMSINETTLLHYIYYIKPISYVIAALISFGTALVVNLYLAFMASKVDAVSALKSVE